MAKMSLHNKPAQCECTKYLPLPEHGCPWSTLRARRKFYMGKCKLLARRTADVGTNSCPAGPFKLCSGWINSKRSRVATLCCHCPRYSLKMLPSLVNGGKEKDEVSPYLASLPISSEEKFLCNTRSRD